MEVGGEGDSTRVHVPGCWDGVRGLPWGRGWRDPMTWPGGTSSRLVKGGGLPPGYDYRQQVATRRRGRGGDPAVATLCWCGMWGGGREGSRHPSSILQQTNLVATWRQYAGWTVLAHVLSWLVRPVAYPGDVNGRGEVQAVLPHVPGLNSNHPPPVYITGGQYLPHITMLERTSTYKTSE